MHFIREYFIRDPSICDIVYNACKKLKSKGYGSPGTAYVPGAPKDFDMTEIKDSWDIMPIDFRDMYPKGPSELRLDELAAEINQVILPRYYNDIELIFRGELFSAREHF